MMLSGIRVISFTHFLQGPSASQILADLGADVIKIEPPAGAFERGWSANGEINEGVSAFFTAANRNVRSVVVDLKNPEALPVLFDLLSTADVLIESFRPGTLDRLGLGYASLRELNPRLVYTSLSGYGSDGPYVDRPGQDVLIQAISGLAAATGRLGDNPTPVGACVVDQHAAVLGALGILAALHGRERTGEGALVQSNLLNAALDLQIEPLNYALNGWLPERSATGVSSAYYRSPYGVFATADGHLCMSLTGLGALTALFDDPWFAAVGEENSYARRDEVNARVAEYLAGDTSAAWMALFAANRIWSAPVQGYAEVLDDPQVLHNDSFDSFEHERAGQIRVLKHPITYDGVRPGIRTAPPELGQHTREVLDDLGYDGERVRSLMSGGGFA